MIVRRRWSDTVLAEYRDDGNPFGGRLIRVKDSTWDGSVSNADSGTDVRELGNNESGRADATTSIPASPRTPRSVSPMMHTRTETRARVRRVSPVPQPTDPDRHVRAGDLVGAQEIALVLDRNLALIYDWFRREDFPKPVAIIGTKLAVYLMPEVRAWYDARPVRGAPEHGTVAKYVGGCRCPQCRKANTTYQLEWRRRRAVAGGA